MYSKILMTKDFQFTKIIFQMPGQAAMEMPMNPNEKERAQMKDDLAKWSQVGTETITVPAGTFSCAHWKKDDGTDEVWTSDKVSPMAMVKQVGKTHTHGAGAADHGSAGSHHRAGDAVRSEGVWQGARISRHATIEHEKKNAGPVSGVFHF